MTDSVAAPGAGDTAASADAEFRSHAGFWGLTLGSLGVVYGDIGTSPLYAFREAIVAASGPGRETLLREGQEELARGAVLGVTSLILWAGNVCFSNLLRQGKLTGVTS